MHTTVAHAANEGGLDAGARGAHVHAHGASTTAGFRKQGGVGAADGVDGIVAKFGLHQAANVIFAKDAGFKLHRYLPEIRNGF